MHDYQGRLVILVTLLIIANGAGWTISIRQARAPAVDLDVSAIPATFDGWQGTDIPQPEAVKRALAGDALLRRTYTRDDVTIDFWAVFGRDWRDVHSPEGCYLADGWSITGGRDMDIPASGTPDGELHGRLFEARKDDARIVAFYLFATNEGTVPNRARLGWSLLKPGNDSYGLLIHAATMADNGEARAAAEVTEFIQCIYPIVARLLGGCKEAPANDVCRRDGNYRATYKGIFYCQACHGRGGCRARTNSVGAAVCDYRCSDQA